MKECKNPTCTRPATATYCDRRCQIAMRTVTKGRALPDVWVPMDTFYKLRDRDEILNLDVRDLVVNMIEASLDR